MNYLYPFKIDYEILFLIDILKDYNISQKTSKAIINFYCGKKIC